MSLKFNEAQFAGLFPGGSLDHETQAVTYKIADADYRIKSPTWSDDQRTLTVIIDHMRGVAFDDHATLAVTFGPDASIQGVSCIWQEASSLAVPDSVVAAVDKAADLIVNELRVAMAVVIVVGVVAAIATEGVSLVVAAEVDADLEEVIKVVQESQKVFDLSTKIYNQLISIIVNYSDNGGRLYTAAVLAHAFNRLAASVTVG